MTPEDFEKWPQRMIVAEYVVGMALTLYALVCCAGCQSVNRVEYYEPTTANAAYSTPRSDKQQGHGPVKAIEGKSGMPDFSDNKSFKFSLNVLGL